jgi:competence protein ComEC
MAGGNGNAKPVSLQDPLDAPPTQRNKRPLVGVAILFGAGILAGSQLAIPSIWPAVVTAAFLVAFFALYVTRFHSWAFFPIPILAGIFLHFDSTEIHSPSDLRNLIGPDARSLILRGIVCDWPETKTKQTPRGELGSTSLTLKVHSVRRGDRWEDALGKVIVRLDSFDQHTEVAYGDELELAGTIERPPVARNPGQFDYRRYLARQGIYYQFHLPHAGDLTLLASRRGNGIMQLAADANEYFKKCLSHGIESEQESVGLLWAIVLGFRPGLTNELSEPFMKTGTLHVFAVSGFHIALVGAILIGMLQLCRLSRKWSGLLSIPLLLIYTLITGAPASAVRSFIMAAVVIVGYSLLRPSDIFNSLAAAALVVLAMNPQQLFDAGFQLSFLVVLMIALFTPRVHDRLLRWAKPDPFLPWDVVPKWRRWMFYPLSKTLLFFSVSFAAVVGSAPLIATYFHLVTPVALISNLLVVPLSGGIIGLGFLSMVTGSFIPLVTDYFNNANFLLLNITVQLNDWMAALPLGHWYVRTPPWPLLLSYYLIVGAMLSGWAWQHSFRRKLTMMAGVLFLAGGAAWYVSPQPTTITVLDVGAGQAVVVDTPGSNDVLVDAGRRTDGHWIVRPYMRQRGISQLAAILLTVNDINHAGGMAAIVEDVPFKQFFHSGFPSRSKEYRELIADLADSNRLHIRNDGGRVELSPALRISVIHPPAEPADSTADDNSIVFVLESDGVRFLFKSEIGASVEERLAQRDLDLRCHVLVTGQHPKETCCTDALLDRVRPEVVIMNAGSFPTYAYPRRDIVERLERRRIPLYRTDVHGGVVVELRAGRYRVQPTLLGESNGNSHDSSAF